jgi:hypothetical protein
MIFTATPLRLHCAERTASTCRFRFMCLKLPSFIIAGLTNPGSQIVVAIKVCTMGTKLWVFGIERDLFQIYGAKNLK